MPCVFATSDYQEGLHHLFLCLSTSFSSPLFSSRNTSIPYFDASPRIQQSRIASCLSDSNNQSLNCAVPLCSLSFLYSVLFLFPLSSQSPPRLLILSSRLAHCRVPSPLSSVSTNRGYWTALSRNSRIFSASEPWRGELCARGGWIHIGNT